MVNRFHNLNEFRAFLSQYESLGNGSGFYPGYLSGITDSGHGDRPDNANNTACDTSRCIMAERRSWAFPVWGFH
jgi:hypothetical protein